MVLRNSIYLWNTYYKIVTRFTDFYVTYFAFLPWLKKNTFDQRLPLNQGSYFVRNRNHKYGYIIYKQLIRKKHGLILMKWWKLYQSLVKCVLPRQTFRFTHSRRMSRGHKGWELKQRLELRDRNHCYHSAWLLGFGMSVWQNKEATTFL